MSRCTDEVSSPYKRWVEAGMTSVAKRPKLVDRREEARRIVDLSHFLWTTVLPGSGLIDAWTKNPTRSVAETIVALGVALVPLARPCARLLTNTVPFAWAALAHRCIASASLKIPAYAACQLPAEILRLTISGKGLYVPRGACAHAEGLAGLNEAARSAVLDAYGAEVVRILGPDSSVEQTFSCAGKLVAATLYGACESGDAAAVRWASRGYRTRCGTSDRVSEHACIGDTNVEAGAFDAIAVRGTVEALDLSLQHLSRCPIRVRDTDGAIADSSYHVTGDTTCVRAYVNGKSPANVAVDSGNAILLGHLFEALPPTLSEYERVLLRTLDRGDVTVLREILRHRPVGGREWSTVARAIGRILDTADSDAVAEVDELFPTETPRVAADRILLCARSDDLCTARFLAKSCGLDVHEWLDHVAVLVTCCKNGYFDFFDWYFESYFVRNTPDPDRKPTSGSKRHLPGLLLCTFFENDHGHECKARMIPTKLCPGGGISVPVLRRWTVGLALARGRQKVCGDREDGVRRPRTSVGSGRGHRRVCIGARVVAAR